MKRILWVEDEKEHYDALSFFLKKRYALVRASDYTEALHNIAVDVFDLYIIDMIIPSGKTLIELNELKKINTIFYGIELIKKIRKQNSDVPIIVLSVIASPRLVDTIKTLDNSIVFLTKYDYSPNEIMEIITSTMNG